MAALGSRALVVTGARSFAATPSWHTLAAALAGRGLAWQHVAVEGEPSPDLVDDAVAAYGRSDIDVVVGQIAPLLLGLALELIPTTLPLVLGVLFHDRLLR